MPKNSKYPMPWSEWAWDDPNKQWARYRLVAEGKYEYGYNPPLESVVPQSKEALRAIPEPSSQYQDQEEAAYTVAAGSPTRATALAPQANFQTPNTRVRTGDVPPNADKFDPNYRLHHSREFFVGRLFKVLWAEPNTNQGGGRGTVGGTEYSTRQNKHGEPLHAKIRRFVIVDSKKGSSICLPIMSYEGRGATKPGVHAEHHAIIYTSPEPVWLTNEENAGMVFKPVKVVPDSGRHKLDKASRLNYAKLYTVEHNVKVWFIGNIHRDFLPQVLNDHNITHPPLTLPKTYTYPQSTAQFNSYQTGAASTAQPPYYPPAVPSNSQQYQVSYNSTSTGNTGYNQQQQWTVARSTYPAVNNSNLNYPPNTGYGSNSNGYTEEQPQQPSYPRDDDLYDP